eukprot:CAMPEP_0168565144 /NCGR_PEP_ID=MMETSP0413-20121227/13657_1 /TAXON_ID=136452 /ORGANISM="Filamoeba nolandi, Strain NC-AS-23-1" /LENGTH=56 /DNA_ID=CAMNT_0008596933 /DNA_START=152 /DNA_END=322 /DNA_ORIENTATION=+
MTSEGKSAATELLQQHRELMESQKKKTAPVWDMRTSPPPLFSGDHMQQTDQDKPAS